MHHNYKSIKSIGRYSTPSIRSVFTCKDPSKCKYCHIMTLGGSVFATISVI